MHIICTILSVLRLRKKTKYQPLTDYSSKELDATARYIKTKELGAPCGQCGFPKTSHYDDNECPCHPTMVPFEPRSSYPTGSICRLEKERGKCMVCIHNMACISNSGMPRFSDVNVPPRPGYRLPIPPHNHPLTPGTMYGDRLDRRELERLVEDNTDPESLNVLQELSDFESSRESELMLKARGLDPVTTFPCARANIDPALVPLDHSLPLTTPPDDHLPLPNMEEEFSLYLGGFKKEMDNKRSASEPAKSDGNHHQNACHCRHYCKPRIWIWHDSRCRAGNTWPRFTLSDRIRITHGIAVFTVYATLVTAVFLVVLMTVLFLKMQVDTETLTKVIRNPYNPSAETQLQHTMDSSSVAHNTSNKPYEEPQWNFTHLVVACGDPVALPLFQKEIQAIKYPSSPCIAYCEYMAGKRNWDRTLDMLFRVCLKLNTLSFGLQCFWKVDPKECWGAVHSDLENYFHDYSMYCLECGCN